MTDYASAKAKMLAAIEAAKKKPNARAELQEMLKRAMSKWGPMVRAFGAIGEAQNHVLGEMGFEPKDTRADSFEFPNWVVEQLRNAIEDIEE